MWTYGIELWGVAKISNINKIQTVHSKILRHILNAPPYTSNETIHKDLNTPVVKQTAISQYKHFHNRLESHPNTLVKALSSLTLPGNPSRRLKRTWCQNLILQ